MTAVRHAAPPRPSPGCSWASSRSASLLARPRRPRHDARDRHAQPAKGAVRLLVSVPGDRRRRLRQGRGEDRRRRRGRLEGRPRVESTEVQRTSILAIDTSNSMKGQRIAEAKKAALAYLASVPANVKVGVVTFDNTVKTLCPRRSTGAPRPTAINGLTLTLQTALYDGVLGALEAAGPGGDDAGQRKILVLSDGKDTTDTQLSDVARRDQASPAPSSTSSPSSRATRPTSR